MTESPWVRYEDRKPTEADANSLGLVLWSWTAGDRVLHQKFSGWWNDPVWGDHKNVQWMPIPEPLPPQPKEMPCFVVDPEQLPVRFTMKDGSCWTAITSIHRDGGDYLIVLEEAETVVEEIPWYDDRIIHVGGWLTKEEITAMQQGGK